MTSPLPVRQPGKSDWRSCMTDRSAARDAFLRGTPWADWDHDPVAGDASARQYVRLRGPDGASVILMDADPLTNGPILPFVSVADWLTGHGLAAPVVHLADHRGGLIVMEDLGPHTIAQAVATTPETTLYDAAVDVLVALDRLTPPAGLIAMTPDVGAGMVAIAAETYAGCDPAPLVAAMHDAMSRLVGPPDRMALRDYHAENLIWRPARAGSDRIGLLDFQDAFVAPRGYDLVSLLRDIRRTVGPAEVERQVTRFTDATGVDPDTFAAQFATLGAQRNLRILGVFARLIANGKPRYARFLPDLWDRLALDLAHPALADLKAVVLRDLPAPDARG